MVITRRRAILETGIQIIIGALAWRLLFDSYFIGQENGVLLSFLGGFVVFVIAICLFSLRTSLALRRAIQKRYGVRLTLNEAAFLRRHEEVEGQPAYRAKVTNSQFPQGLVLTDTYKRTWALRDAATRTELSTP